MRNLNHEGKEVSTQHDRDFCSSVYYKGEMWPIYFLRNDKGEFVKYNSGYKDWYIQVAIEKLDKIKDQRHLINSELLLSYRWAIREGYNHELDRDLRNSYDYPRNRNTIKGVQGYIARIKKASEEEMEEIRREVI